MTNKLNPKRAAAKAKKAHSTSAQETPCLPIHDIEGAVVFPLSTELKELLGAQSFENLCDELRRYEVTLIYRTPKVIVYLDLTPVVVPMDVTTSQEGPLSNPATANPTKASMAAKASKVSKASKPMNATKALKSGASRKPSSNNK